MKAPRCLQFSSPLFLLVWYAVALVLCIGVFVAFGREYLVIFALLALVWGIYNLLNGLFLHQELHRRGYEWVRFLDAFRLATQHFHRPWMLPHRDELATVPEYTDTVSCLGVMLNRKYDIWKKQPAGSGRKPND
ncbi:MAG: hypothetical protein JJU11_03800 [Candidatus Sumerlaeia bacterium]|nr:hypothetical protein [Candidatus Sumerlaeia bacterium]